MRKAFAVGLFIFAIVLNIVALVLIIRLHNSTSELDQNITKLQEKLR